MLELLRDHGHAHRLGAEVLAKALEQRAFRDLGPVDDVVEKALEKESELFRRGLILHGRERIADRASEPLVRLPANGASGRTLRERRALRQPQRPRADPREDDRTA